MLIGIPTETKEDENRVAITPAGVAAFARGINVVGGGVVHKAVADAHGLEHTPLNKL